MNSTGFRTYQDKIVKLSQKAANNSFMCCIYLDQILYVQLSKGRVSYKTFSFVKNVSSPVKSSPRAHA